MAPKAKTLSDEDLDQLDEELEGEIDDFGEGIDEDAPVPESEDIEPEALDEPEPEEEPESVTVRGIAEKFGFQLEDTDDEATALESFFGQVSQFRDQARQIAQERQQLQQQLAYFHQQRQQPPQPQQPQAPQKQELTGLLKHWQNVPEWHDEWLSYVKYDDNGELVSKPGADPTLPQKIEAYRRWEKQAQQSFFHNPQQFAFEAVQANPAFQDYLQKQIHQAVYGLQDRLQSQQIAAQREQYIYRTNPQGGRELTPAGQAYLNAVQLASDRGITDTTALDEIAWTAALPYVQAAQAQQAQQTQETPRETKKRRQLELSKKGAAKKPNRGPAPSAKRKIKSQEDFMNVALARMEAAGIDPHQKISG